MVKTAKVQEDDDSGAGVVLLAIGVTAGLWAWLRSRQADSGPAFALVPRSQAQSQPAATSPTSRPRRDSKESKPQFGYDDRAQFGFVF